MHFMHARRAAPCSAQQPTQDPAQRQDAGVAAARRRSRRRCPWQQAPCWPRIGQSGRAAAAGREVGGAAEGREAAMWPKAEGQAAQQPRSWVWTWVTSWVAGSLGSNPKGATSRRLLCYSRCTVAGSARWPAWCLTTPRPWRASGRSSVTWSLGSTRRS